MDYTGRRDADDERFRQAESASPSSQRFVGGLADQQPRTSPFDYQRNPAGGAGASGMNRGFDALDSSASAWYPRPLGGEPSQQGRGVGIDYSQALGLEPPLHHTSTFPPPSYNTPPPRVSAPSTTSGFGVPPAGADPFYSGHAGHPMRRSPSRDSMNSAGDYLNNSVEGRGSPALSVASSSGYRSFHHELPGTDPRQPPLPPRDSSSPFQPPASSSSANYDPRRMTPSSGSARGINASYDELRSAMDTGGYGSARATPVNSFRPVTPPYSSSLPPPPTPKKRDVVDPVAGAAVQFASLFAENLLSHPCVVMRRQCQVHHRSRLYHVTPFAIVRVILNLQRYQGLSTFWKGIGSTFMVKGLFLVSEQVISEVTPFRREVSYESSNLKQVSGHVALKALSHCLVTPFFSAALIESVQSDIASERPGIFDCVREGSFRLLGYGMPQSTRLFPVWHLVIPTALHGTLHYVIAAATQWGVVSLLKRDDAKQPRIYSPSPVYPSQQGYPTEVPTDNSTAVMVETFYREVLGAFCGHLLADVLLYPLETVLHRLHLQGTRTIIDDLDSGLSVLPITTRYDGVFDCFRCILREEGRLGLLKGFGALIIQYSIHFALIKITKILLDQVAELSRNSSHDKRRM